MNFIPTRNLRRWFSALPAQLNLGAEEVVAHHLYGWGVESFTEKAM
jgi:hypothetical protein